MARDSTVDLSIGDEAEPSTDFELLEPPESDSSDLPVAPRSESCTVLEVYREPW